MMFGKIWYNPDKQRESVMFLTILYDLDTLDNPDELGFSPKGYDLHIADKLYQANRNRYPSLTV